MGQCLPSISRLFGAKVKAVASVGAATEEMMTMVGADTERALADPTRRFVLSAARRRELEQLQLTFDAKGADVQKDCDRASRAFELCRAEVARCRAQNMAIAPKLLLQFRMRKKELDAHQRAALMYENALSAITTVLSTTEQIQSVAQVNSALRKLAAEFDLRGAETLITENQESMMEIGEINDTLLQLTVAPVSAGGTYTLMDGLGGEVELTPTEEAELDEVAPPPLPVPAAAARTATPAPTSGVPVFALPAADRSALQAERERFARAVAPSASPTAARNPLFSS